MITAPVPDSIRRARSQSDYSRRSPATDRYSLTELVREIESEIRLSWRLMHDARRNLRAARDAGNTDDLAPARRAVAYWRDHLADARAWRRIGLGLS